MDYYKKVITIAQVNDKDEITGEIERWEAHKKGILHRGFTVILTYRDLYICQLRKHPVFNGVIDFAASSHQIYAEGKMQDINEAVAKTLEREWNMKPEDLTAPVKLAGKVQYNSFDGTYTEHELCHFYLSSVSKLPSFNNDFAYGYALFSRDELKNLTPPLNTAIAPWVKECLVAGIV